MLMIWSVLCTFQPRTRSELQLHSGLGLINTGGSVGSHGALRAEMQRRRARARTLPRPVQGCRGATVGCEGLHGDSGGRGEYGVKKRRACG